MSEVKYIEDILDEMNAKDIHLCSDGRQIPYLAMQTVHLLNLRRVLKGKRKQFKDMVELGREIYEGGWACGSCTYEYVGVKKHPTPPKVCPRCGEVDTYVELDHDVHVQLRKVNKELRRRKQGVL